MKKTKSRALVIKDSKILLLFRRKNGKEYYSIPGGTVEEYDDSFETAAIRETFEETSININIVKKLFETNENYDKKHQILYLANYVNGAPKLNESIEKEIMSENNYYEPMWVDIEEIENIKIMPKTLGKYIKVNIESLI